MGLAIRSLYLKTASEMEGKLLWKWQCDLVDDQIRSKLWWEKLINRGRCEKKWPIATSFGGSDIVNAALTEVTNDLFYVILSF